MIRSSKIYYICTGITCHPSFSCCVFPTCLHLSSAAFLSVSACSARSMAFSLSSFSICIFFLMASMVALWLDFLPLKCSNAPLKLLVFVEMEVVQSCLQCRKKLKLNKAAEEQRKQEREKQKGRDRRKETERAVNRDGVKPYKDGYLNFNRTCLQSLLTTPITILLPCFTLPPCSHHFPPSSPSLSIPLFTSHSPLCVHSILTPWLSLSQTYTQPYQTTHPSSLSQEWSGCSTLQLWLIPLFGLLCFHKETEIRLIGPHLNPCQWVLPAHISHARP